MYFHRETLKRFLSRFTETIDVLGSFDLDPLEAQDRQLKFQGVRFEVMKASPGCGGSYLLPLRLA